MKINICKEKTEFMPISRISEEYYVYLGREKLNQVEEYTYLGIKLDSKNTQEMETGNRIVKYNNNVRPMCPLLKDKTISRGWDKLTRNVLFTLFKSMDLSM